MSLSDDESEDELSLSARYSGRKSSTAMSSQSTPSSQRRRAPARTRKREASEERGADRKKRVAGSPLDTLPTPFQEFPSAEVKKRWHTLQHNGVMFPPEYEPHGVKPLYDGRPVDLTPEQEEAATFFAVMLDTDYAGKPVFVKNFWEDFRALLGGDHAIQEFDRIDFGPIHEWHQAEKQKSKALSKEEKKEIRLRKQEAEEKYKTALVDGQPEQVGIGTSSRAAAPEAVRLGWQLSRGAPGSVPRTRRASEDGAHQEAHLPAGHHDQHRSRRADPGAPISRTVLEGRPPRRRRDLAGLLEGSHIAEGLQVRVPGGEQHLQERERHGQVREGQEAEGAHRPHPREVSGRLDVGGSAEEADGHGAVLHRPPGAEGGPREGRGRGGHGRLLHAQGPLPRTRPRGGGDSLQVENVECIQPNRIRFDFLGKDSIRYENTVKVDEQVYNNVAGFCTCRRNGTRKGTDGRLSDDHPGSVCRKAAGRPAVRPVRRAGPEQGAEGADGRALCQGVPHVQRVHHAAAAARGRTRRTASGRAQAVRLRRGQQAGPRTRSARRDPGLPCAQVAILCNHQRAVPKTHDNQIERLTEKVSQLEQEIREIDDAIGDLKGAASSRDQKQLAVLQKRREKKAAQRERVQVQMQNKESLKTVALGTSKINYLDPRISVAWCKRHEMPIEKIYTNTLLQKFGWAMTVTSDFRF